MYKKISLLRDISVKSFQIKDNKFFSITHNTFQDISG